MATGTVKEAMAVYHDTLAQDGQPATRSGAA